MRNVNAVNFEKQRIHVVCFLKHNVNVLHFSKRNVIALLFSKHNMNIKKSCATVPLSLLKKWVILQKFYNNQNIPI